MKPWLKWTLGTVLVAAGLLGIGYAVTACVSDNKVTTHQGRADAMILDYYIGQRDSTKARELCYESQRDLGTSDETAERQDWQKLSRACDDALAGRWTEAADAVGDLR